MKKVILIIGVLLVTFQSFGQSKPDSALIAYAKNKGYVKITDTLHLPAIAKPYYSDIMRYFDAGHSSLKEMYVWVKYVRDTPAEIEVPLEDISSIDYHKKKDERNLILQAHPDTIIINGKKTVAYKMDVGMFGNISGHDGVVRINKNTRQVGFLMSQ